jgi:hypothetical protein
MMKIKWDKKTMMYLVVGVLVLIILIQSAKLSKAQSIATKLNSAGFKETTAPNPITMTTGIGTGQKAAAAVTTAAANKAAKTTTGTTKPTFDPSRFYETVTRSADGRPAPTKAEYDAYDEFVKGSYGADGKTRLSALVQQFIVATDTWPNQGIFFNPSKSGLVMVGKNLTKDLLQNFIYLYNATINADPVLAAKLAERQLKFKQLNFSAYELVWRDIADDLDMANAKNDLFESVLVS